MFHKVMWCKMWCSTIFLLLFFSKNTETMSLRGPSHTMYDPCGLSVIQMEKLDIYNGMTDVWLLVINFYLYPNLVEAKMKIEFEDPIIPLQTNQDPDLLLNSTRDLEISPSDVIPKHFHLHIKTENNNSVPTVKRFTLNEMELCNEEEKRSQTVQALELTAPNDTKRTHICGRRPLQHTELTTTGSDAELGDWPWHVAIYLRDETNTKANYRCGGNVVSSTAVLTAGHCLSFGGVVIETHRVVIFAGMTNLNKLNENTTQRLMAEKIIFHPGYKEEEATSDLAVVKVNRFTYTEYVQPICLWGPVFEKTDLFGMRGVVAGFGMTENGTYPDALRSTQIVVQSDDTCKTYSQQLYQSLLNEFSFCAGFGPTSGINPKNGDSGGGFILPTQQPDHKISWVLRGVLSKCGRPINGTFCDERFYVVYTDVGPHYSWILHHAGLKFTNNIM